MGCSWINGDASLGGLRCLRRPCHSLVVLPFTPTIVVCRLGLLLGPCLIPEACHVVLCKSGRTMEIYGALIHISPKFKSICASFRKHNLAERRNGFIFIWILLTSQENNLANTYLVVTGDCSELFILWIITTTLWGRQYYCAHIKKQEIKAQWSLVVSNWT